MRGPGDEYMETMRQATEEGDAGLSDEAAIRAQAAALDPQQGQELSLEARRLLGHYGEQPGVEVLQEVLRFLEDRLQKVERWQKMHVF